MASFTNHPKLTDRFSQALTFAFNAHQKQIRKQGNIPYISHLMAVSSLVLEAGGNENEAITALLHDALEDAGIEAAEIQKRFGSWVATTVISLSEDKGIPASERKAEYIKSIEFAPLHRDSVQLISCADKYHNLRGYNAHRRLWSQETAHFYARLMPIYHACERIPEKWIVEMYEILKVL